MVNAVNMTRRNSKGSLRSIKYDSKDFRLTGTPNSHTLSLPLPSSRSENIWSTLLRDEPRCLRVCHILPNRLAELQPAVRSIGALAAAVPPYDAEAAASRTLGADVLRGAQHQAILHTCHRYMANIVASKVDAAEALEDEICAGDRVLGAVDTRAAGIRNAKTR